MLPIAILLPHAGLEIPPEVAGRLAIGEREVFHEADIYTEAIYDFRDRVRQWLAFPYARAIVDVNRSNGHHHTRPGDGIVKRKTSYGAKVYQPGAEPGAALEDRMIDRYWRPWHQQLAALAVDQEIKLVIDCHSMAAFGPGHYDDPDAIRPRACVANLGDGEGRAVGHRHLTAPPALARALAGHLGDRLADLPALAPAGPAAALNRPFAGGWDIWAHGGKRQPWLMIEISRGLYVGPQDAAAPTSPPRRREIELLRDRIWQAIEATWARRREWG
ncbi:MAG: N-formylglutamate amidohydrolase [Caldilineales bacterium]|nr:N-formylglutamate amidohydrolase [Caldilineales bacterium]